MMPRTDRLLLGNAMATGIVVDVAADHQTRPAIRLSDSSGYTREIHQNASALEIRREFRRSRLFRLVRQPHTRADFGKRAFGRGDRRSRIPTRYRQYQILVDVEQRGRWSKSEEGLRRVFHQSTGGLVRLRE